MSQAKDPVCGMTVETGSAHEGTFAGHTYYFCSEQCRSSFENNPSAYSASANAEPLERHEPPFTVAGGMPAPKFGSAGSGGAEYERLPERHDNKRDKRD